jgi:hypothetical protein
MINLVYFIPYIMKKIKLLSIFLLSISFFSNAQSWTQLGEISSNVNTDNSILSVTVDFSTGYVYAAGYFKNTDGYRYVAKWDGSYWSELGTGSNALKANGYIKCIASDQTGNVYAAGNFSNANGKYYVAKWNGTTWSELGTGVNELGSTYDITCLTVDAQGNVYTSRNNSVLRNIQKWNGTTWEELGGTNGLNANDGINSIVADAAGNIYAAGWFSYGNGRMVSKWNGTSWAEVGGSTDGLKANSAVMTLAVDGLGNVYAAGQFLNGNGKEYVAKWDGTSWAEMGTGTNSLNAYGTIFSIATDALGHVYAAGQFEIYGAPYVAQWNGTKWIVMGGTVNNIPYVQNPYFYNDFKSIVSDASGNVYVGGQFLNANHKYYIAKWVSGVTATQQNTRNDEVTLYPNPANQRVAVDLKESGLITIYNFSGELVKTQKVDAGISSIDISEFTAGVYTLIFKGENTTLAPAKIVKE